MKSESNKTTNLVLAIMILLILVFSVVRIATKVISRQEIMKRYQVDYDQDILEFSSIEELELMYEDLDYSIIQEMDHELQDIFHELSNEIYSVYVVELDDEQINNFQIVYKLSDESNKEWSIHYNYDYGSQTIAAEVEIEDENVEDLMNKEMFNQLCKVMYGATINQANLYNQLIEEGNQENFYFNDDHINLEIEAMEGIYTISIYQN